MPTVLAGLDLRKRGAEGGAENCQGACCPRGRLVVSWDVSGFPCMGAWCPSGLSAISTAGPLAWPPTHRASPACANAVRGCAGHVRNVQQSWGRPGYGRLGRLPRCPELRWSGHFRLRHRRNSDLGDALPHGWSGHFRLRHPRNSGFRDALSSGGEATAA